MNLFWCRELTLKFVQTFYDIYIQYLAAQGAKLDFGFDLQPLLSLTGLRVGRWIIAYEHNVPTFYAYSKLQNDICNPKHTHTLDQHHKLASFGSIIDGMNQSPLPKKYKHFEHVGHQ